MTTWKMRSSSRERRRRKFWIKCEWQKLADNMPDEIVKEGEEKEEVLDEM